MSALHSGLSAIRASQAAIDTIAHNIANAGTPGYHRQTVDLRARPSLGSPDGFLIGDGVDIAGVRQIRSQLLESAVARNSSAQSANAAELEIVRNIETLVTPVDGSLADRVQEFFNSVQRLSSSPQDVNLRQTLLSHADNLAKELNSLAASLDRLSSDTVAEIQATAGQINELTGDLARLNKQIRNTENTSGRALGLRDQRDQLIGQIAALIDVDLRTDSDGKTVALLGGNTVLVGEVDAQLRISTRDGEIIATQAGIERDVDPQGGRLQGLLDGVNRVIPSFVDRLDTLAQEVARIIDSVHSEGVGLDGAFSLLTSERPVSSVSAPLAESVSGLPANNGELLITVTDVTTGERSLARLAIDPATQSLQDLASVISGVDHLTATVIDATGQLSISAENGFTFDFTGQLQQAPDTSLFAGTSDVRVKGRYDGAVNDELTLTVSNPGEVGVDPNVTVEVRKADGTLLSTLNVGQGYPPGSDIAIGEGVFISFGAGSVNVGDSVSVGLIADPDTSDVLAALGLNTLFTGTTARDLSLVDRIQRNPASFAGSSTGAPGDSGNLLRLINQRDSSKVSGTNLSPEEFLADIVAESGRRTNALDVLGEHLGFLGESFAAERESLSGVSPDEEMLGLLKHQRSFQAAAQLISAVDQSLNELLRILG